MIGAIETFAAFVLVLGVLVFVHEAGHFIVAKAFGIGVPVFSLGFGPRLFGFRRGGTDYRVSLIPLGGYVRMTGDESDEARVGAPEEFLSRPRWQRLLVFVAGPAFNIVLALLITWLLFWTYGSDEILPSESHPIVAVVLPGSTAETAGVEVGDRVLSIAGRDTRDRLTMGEEIVLSPNQVKEIVVERGERRLTLQLDTGADPRFHLGAPGWAFVQDTEEPPEILEVIAGMPAERAGLEAGDRILAIDDRKPATEPEVRQVLASSAGREVSLEVERGGGTRTIRVTPEQGSDGRARIGVQFRPAGLVHLEFTAAEAFSKSIRVNLEMSTVLFTTLRKWIRQEISTRAFSGPIEIAQVSRDAFRGGLERVLQLLAFISLQLGILNLLPIPVLDGGHILILGVEGVMRRDLSDRIKERAMQVGLVLLLIFFVRIIYNDVVKVFFPS